LNGLLIVFLSYSIVSITFAALGLEGTDIGNSNWFKYKDSEWKATSDHEELG
jgi:hypothetical protein